MTRPENLDGPAARRREQALAYTSAVEAAQTNREAQVRAALTAGATYLTLMSASATGRGADIDADRVDAAQFLLSLLFAGTLAYLLTTICNHALAIADDAARRLELEHEDAADEAGGGVPAVETRAYARQARGWRVKSRWPAWVLAGIPRYGQSQRHALLFLPVVAILPAAWFTIAINEGWVTDAVIVALTVALGVIWVRLLFAGCRHWLYVHPKDLVVSRWPSEWSPPAWGWWFYRCGARDTVLSRFFIRRRERWQEDQTATAREHG